MGAPYAGNNVFPGNITVVEGTDLLGADPIAVGLEGLADRTAYLLARIPGGVVNVPLTPQYAVPTEWEPWTDASLGIGFRQSGTAGDLLLFPLPPIQSGTLQSVAARFNFQSGRAGPNQPANQPKVSLFESLSGTTPSFALIDSKQANASTLVAYEQRWELVIPSINRTLGVSTETLYIGIEGESGTGAEPDLVFLEKIYLSVDPDA